MSEFELAKEIRTDVDRFGWIREKLDTSKGSKILDVGCGDAKTWEGLWDIVAPNLTLFDMDKRNLPTPMHVGDAHNLPFEDNSFDDVVCGEMLEHVDVPVRVLQEAKRVSRNRILITTPDEFNWIGLYKPFTPLEEVLIETGMTAEEHARASNPDVVEFSKDLKHIGHNRYYTEEMLKKHLKEAGLKNYTMEHLLFDGWAFFCCIVYIDW